MSENQPAAAPVDEPARVIDPDLAERAGAVAVVFRILALVAIIVYAALAVAVLITDIIAGAEDHLWGQGIFGGIIGGLALLIWGVVTWALLTLISIVARYIANRS